MKGNCLKPVWPGPCCKPLTSINKKHQETIWNYDIDAPDGAANAGFRTQTVVWWFCRCFWKPHQCLPKVHVLSEILRRGIHLSPQVPERLQVSNRTYCLMFFECGWSSFITVNAWCVAAWESVSSCSIHTNTCCTSYTYLRYICWRDLHTHIYTCHHMPTAAYVLFYTLTYLDSMLVGKSQIS